MRENKFMTLKCSSCGESISVESYDSVNVAARPELKNKILDGSLFMAECPHCGKINLARFQVLYHDPTAKLMFYLTLGDVELEVRAGNMFATVPEMSSDYVLRFVDEPGELIEKVKIFDAGLDDVVMELCKYVTRMELCEKAGDGAKKIMDAPFRFLKVDGADHDITLAYPMDSQMQMVEVGFNVYEDCAGIISRNPQLTSTLSGMCHVDADWVAVHIR